MSELSAPIPGHTIKRWPNEIRWTGTRNVTTALRAFGCECGVDYTSDDPYGEHEAHLIAVNSTLARRRWTEAFTA